MAKENIERKLTERQHFWLGHLHAWEKSGDTMKSYAAVHGLDLRPFYHWKSWLTRKGLFHRVSKRPLFKKLKIERPSTGCRLHLPNGAMIEWDAPLAVDDLSELVRAVGELP